MRYESIAICTEIMEINLSNLYNIVRGPCEISPDNPKFDTHSRTLMMSLAWGIVDQADLLRKLIRAEGKSIELSSARDFLARAETARELRNWMDHLPERLTAFLEKKQKLPPAHGALSWTYVDPVDAQEATHGKQLPKYRTILVLSCAMQRAMEVKGVPFEYEKFDVPIDHFVLQSFGHDLQLIGIVEAASKFCDDLAERVEKFCRSTAFEIAAKSGQSIADVMKPSEVLGGTLVMVATAQPSNA